jgi:hypothetical protein
MEADAWRQGLPLRPQRSEAPWIPVPQVTGDRVTNAATSPTFLATLKEE